MAALCCPSPWSVMAELKLGQNIHRNSVPARWENQIKPQLEGCSHASRFDKDKHKVLSIDIYIYILSISLVTHQSWQTRQSGRQTHWGVYFGEGSVGRGPRRCPNHSILRKHEWPWSHQHLYTVEILIFHCHNIDEYTQQQHKIEIAILGHRSGLCRMIFLAETHMKEVEDDEFLHGKQCDAKQGHHQQLDRAYFSQEGTVGDQRASAAEVCIDQTVGKHM